ncbi:MAG: hypothetical protein WC891_08335 [Actinomycetota bacterium]
MAFDKRFYGKWVLYTALGELFGFLAPVAAGVIGALIIGEATSPLGIAATLLLAAVGGLGEGSILAAWQAAILKKRLPDLNRARFIIYTALAAALAWIIGMSPSTINNSVELPVWVWIVIGIIGVPFFLVSIGGAQWLELRKHVKKAWIWIIANAIAWPAGVMIPVFGIQLVPDTSAVWVFVAAGIISGVMMGAAVGAITGLFLVNLLKRHPGRASCEQSSWGSTD